MAFAAGGRLAAAVTDAGGLGLIGGGYGNAVWLEDEFRAAGNTSVGYGFHHMVTRPQSSASRSGLEARSFSRLGTRNPSFLR